MTITTRATKMVRAGIVGVKLYYKNTPKVLHQHELNRIDRVLQIYLWKIIPEPNNPIVVEVSCQICPGVFIDQVPLG